MGEDGKAFWEVKNEAFVPARPEMDLLHPEAREQEPSAALTETQYLGFNIPEHDIHGLCYLWHHPNLGVVSGGAWAWQGVKGHNLECELFDMLTYVDDSVLDNDLHRVVLPNSYTSRVIEPMQKLRLEYEDADRGNRLALDYEAVMPAMAQASGQHFEQAMRVTGTATLAGTDYTVDGYTVRDRSWGAPRNEAHVPAPPMAWMTGVFGDDFAFGTTAWDTLDRHPEWQDTMQIPGGEALRGGWVYRDGEIVPVVDVSKRLHRNTETLFPERIEMVITAADGQKLDLTGTILAAANWRTWHNMDSIICLTRWECDGRVGHGDTQDVLWRDYVRRFRGNREAFAGSPVSQP